jgi:ABC-type sugar transport system permease subunit
MGLAFSAPSIIMIGVFVIWPLGRLGYYSLSNVTGLAAPEFVGLDNYAFLLQWSDLHRIVLNTMLLAAGGIAVWVVVPFVLALLIFESPQADRIRAVLFIPAILPPVIVGSAFRILLAEQGPLNGLLRTVGLDALALPWLTRDWLVLVSVVLVIAWAVMGSGILFYSAGLAAMSRDYIEAALLDGARWHQLVWHIYRPALRPITRFWIMLLTITTVTGFFPWIFGLTQGGPGIASTTLDYQVYVSGIRSSRLGLGSAIAVVGIVVIVILLGCQLLAARLRRASSWS